MTTTDSDRVAQPGRHHQVDVPEPGRSAATHARRPGSAAPPAPRRPRRPAAASRTPPRRAAPWRAAHREPLQLLRGSPRRRPPARRPGEPNASDHGASAITAAADATTTGARRRRRRPTGLRQAAHVERHVLESVRRHAPSSAACRARPRPTARVPRRQRPGGRRAVRQQQRQHAGDRQVRAAPTATTRPRARRPVERPRPEQGVLPSEQRESLAQARSRPSSCGIRSAPEPREQHRAGRRRRRARRAPSSSQNDGSSVPLGRRVDRVQRRCRSRPASTPRTSRCRHGTLHARHPPRSGRPGVTGREVPTRIGACVPRAARDGSPPDRGCHDLDHRLPQTPSAPRPDAGHDGPTTSERRFSGGGLGVGVAYLVGHWRSSCRLLRDQPSRRWTPRRRKRRRASATPP